MGTVATVVNRGIDAPASRKEIRKANEENFNPIINGRMMRDPLRRVFIHSVAKRSFIASNLPLFPKLELRGTDPAINNGRWITCTSVPDPIVQISADNERGGNRLDDNDAWAAVADLLNPLCGQNATMDPYAGASNPDFYANRRGTILVCEGIFPSLNEVPTEEELRRAEAARDKRYRWGTSNAMKLAAKSTKDLNEFLDTNPWVHEAMDAQGLSAPWHQENVVKSYCPNCGDSVRQGLAFHQSSAGILCVIDPEKALRAGAINKSRFKELTEQSV